MMILKLNLSSQKEILEMNHTVEGLLNHRSIRKYHPEMIDSQSLDLIVKSAQAAPNSINGQQISVIVVTDEAKKAKVAELAGGQAWIAEAPVFLLFVMDYHRAKLAAEKNGEQLVITESLESIMVSSVDVGIALGTAVVAAESMGLGTVPIGGIRRAPEEIIELFELPEFVYPVAGLVVGKPMESSSQKPRIPEALFRHENVYNPDQLELLNVYDQEISEYMKARTGGESDRNWSQGVSSTYKYVYFPKVYPSIRKQGFANDK